MATQILGLNTLQQLIDKLNTAADKLDDAANKMTTGLGTMSRQASGTGGASSSGSFGNTGSTQQQTPAANIGTAFFPKVFNPFRPQNINLNNGAPNAQGFSTQIQPQQMTFGQIAAMNQGMQGNFNNPGGGPPGTYNPAVRTPSAGGNGGWGIAIGAGIGAAGGAIMGGMLGAGAGQLQQQAIANYFSNQAYAAGAPGGMSLGSYNTALRYNTFGSGNANLNYMAYGTRDAAAGMANVMSAAGTATPWQTPLGQTIMRAQGTFAYANQGMSSAQTSGLAGSVYSPAFSANMMRMGYGTTPLRMGGGAANMAGVDQSVIQRIFGRSYVSPQKFQAAMSRVGGVDLQALGLSPSQTGAFEQQLSTMNRLRSRGVGYQTASTWMNEAEHAGTSTYDTAVSNLTRYGVPMSDIQRMKANQATQTGRMSDQAGPFNAAMQTSASLVNKFNQAISSFLKDTGLGSIVGGMHGIGAGGLPGVISSTLNDITNPVGSVVSGIMHGMAAPMAGGSSASAMGNSHQNTISSGVSGQAREAVGAAEKEIGVPYVWGGESPGKGFDCSGLVQWAYGQAGVKLPRTSEQQWAFLRNRAINPKDAEEGDLVFMAGSDGTPNDPGHVGMMVSKNSLIQAPYTGADVQIIGYDPRAWSHVARPTGSMKGSSGPAGAGTLAGQQSNLMTAGQGNAGAPPSGGLGGYGGTYGSVDELAALQGASTGGTAGVGLWNIPGAQAGNGSGMSGSVGANGGAANAPTSVTGDVALGKQLAAKRGWTGGQWGALYQLWQHESNWNRLAKNPGSGAYGIPQALPGSKMGAAANPPQSNAAAQIMWGLNYIGSVYQNPENAWSKWQGRNPHWYGFGTASSAEGLHVVGDRGREMVKLPAGSTVFNNAQTEKIMKAADAQMPMPGSLFNGVPSGTQGSGLNLSVNFNQGSIQINGSNYPNMDLLVNSITQEIGDRVEKSIKDKQLVASIAGGMK